jgi:hypothetical protein
MITIYMPHYIRPARPWIDDFAELCADCEWSKAGKRHKTAFYTVTREPHQAAGLHSISPMATFWERYIQSARKRHVGKSMQVEFCFVIISGYVALKRGIAADVRDGASPPAIAGVY